MRDAQKLLLDAVNRGDTRDVVMALDAGADADTRGIMNRPVLITAITLKDILTVRRLLERGSNPNISDFQGLSPLMWAVKMDRRDILKLLLKHGADVNMVDSAGRSALVHSVLRGDAVATSILLQNNASVDVLYLGRPLLVYATRFPDRRYKLVRMILDAGASPETLVDVDVNDNEFQAIRRKALKEFLIKHERFATTRRAPSPSPEPGLSPKNAVARHLTRTKNAKMRVPDELLQEVIRMM